ncbi:hypothetical protein IV203_029864 [Nitzschia inconspicua]|uniref:Uncharacterized protein n=1 Tax=Nitzschia inconspicua TaxID=303405 RepID=A0A9K3LSK4_9STRA|nr:hypothetical protein IV203_029864 [Nitzschia inconspicua]
MSSDHSRTTVIDKDEISPPVSPVKELDPLLSQHPKYSPRTSTNPPSTPTFKEFGPRENKFPLFQTSQEELIRVAVEKKQASSRIRQSIALRAALAEWDRPFVMEETEDDFAVVLEEDGEFVMSCLQ